MPTKPPQNDDRANPIAPFEITALCAAALDMVGYAFHLPLRHRASAQGRGLLSCASKARSYVTKAEFAAGPGSARRRRIAYERAYECVAVFAMVLADLLHFEHISREDFDRGRDLAARARVLLDPQVGVTTIRIAATVLVPTPGLPRDPRRDRN